MTHQLDIMREVLVERSQAPMGESFAWPGEGLLTASIERLYLTVLKNERSQQRERATSDGQIVFEATFASCSASVVGIVTDRSQ